MINKKDVWNNAVEAMQGYAPYYQKEAVRAIEDAHARNVWFVLLLARGAEPQPITLDYYQTINPYSSPARLSEQLEQAASEGFLKESDPGSFHLSAAGLSVLDAFFKTAHAGISNAPALPTAEMNRLVEFFTSIVAATEAAPAPKNKISLASSRWTDPGEGANATVKVDQYITDLLRYRDDAHTAAWQPSGVNGQQWESLTFIWNEEADTAAQLAENLERRGYSEADYAAALNELAKRDWLSEKNGRYQLTAQGRRIRDEAEIETDRLFYIGWTDLDQEELTELDNLLGELKTLLLENAAAEAVAV